jgi:16S rRNA processing protein RimM
VTAPEPDLRIGRVLKAHGVKGAVRVELLTDFPERFKTGSEIDVGGRRLRVEQSQEQDGGLIITFEGITDRDAAEALTGAYCTVPLSAAKPLPDDRYYHFQLVGLPVFDARQQRELGRVAEVLTYSANDVLRVVNGKTEILIPMVKSVVRVINPNEGSIIVDLPEEIDA